METIGCSGMTHSAAMASEILPGKTILEALNTDLVCDAINAAMRRTLQADRLRPHPVRLLRRRPAHRRRPGGPGQGPALPGGHHVRHRRQGRPLSGDGRGLRRSSMALDEDNEVIGYQFVSLGKMMEAIKTGHGAPMRRMRRTSAPTAASRPRTARSSGIDPPQSSNGGRSVTKWLMFEGYERRMPQLEPVLEKYGFKDSDELKACQQPAKGVDVDKIVRGHPAHLL